MREVRHTKHERLPRTVTLLSFSGIDGAGKTTQINALKQFLTETSTRVSLFSFWDDVAVATSMRTELVHRLFGGERGIGRPDKPVQRRDKDVRSWYMTAARVFFYSLDTLRTNLAVRKARKSEADVVIFDRYIYDELANLFPGRWFTRTYGQFLLWCTPKLDMAFLLDADPQGARERKPEYPLTFLKRNRQSYLALAQAAGMTVIPPLPAREVSHKIIKEIQTHLSLTHPQRVEAPAHQQEPACEESAPVGADQ